MAVTAHSTRVGAAELVIFEGFLSEGTLRHFCHAISDWLAFSRFPNIAVDLTGFTNWTPDVVNELRRATAKLDRDGRWLALSCVSAPDGIDLRGLSIFTDPQALSHAVAARLNLEESDRLYPISALS